MKQKLFSIRDLKAEYFNTPWVANTHGEAERNFQDLASDKQSKIAMHPTDYELWYLGEFDTENGQIESKLQHVANAKHQPTNMPGLEPGA